MLEELTSPDSTDSYEYNWDKALQTEVMTLLIHDKQFFLQSIDLIKPAYFPYKAYKVVFGILVEHYGKYKTHPTKADLIQELKEKLNGDKALPSYLGDIEALYEYYEAGLDSREYLADKILMFAKMMAFRGAWDKSIKILNKEGTTEDSWSKVYKIFQDAFNVDRNFSAGLEYFKTLHERYKRMGETDSVVSDKFETGNKSVDENIKGQGYRRGELIAVCAESGVGKSIWLTNMACHNAKRGYKVCYISLELSEDRVAERFDSIFTGTNINLLYDFRNDVISKLENLVPKEKNPVLIKWFPPKTADTNTIRAYLNQLKFYGYEPDILIVDYIGEMKLHPGMEQYESLETLVSELRGLVGEIQAFGATAMQPNRDAKKALKENGMIDASHLANGHGQIRPLDGFITLNQNDFEATMNIGRGYVDKQRFGKSKYTYWVKFDRENLRIYEISREEYKNIMNKGKGKSAAKAIDTDMDTIHSAVESDYDPSGSVVDEIG